jgi:outer membrane immunogenic protein
MKRALVSLSILGFALAPAFAADLPVKARPMAPAAVVAYNWSGCYIGGNVGAGWLRDDQTRIGNVAGGVFNDNMGSGSHTNLIGGGQIGCDYQFASSWVVGLQGMVNFGSNTESHANPTFAGFRDETTLKHTVTGTARLGYLFAPQVLGYVKGGAAFARVDYTNFQPSGALSETASETRLGWTIGGGVEWMFAQGWSVFGEFNYLDFGTRDVAFTAAPGTVNPASIIRTRLSESQALFGVNYKFNWAGPVVARY